MKTDAMFVTLSFSSLQDSVFQFDCESTSCLCTDKHVNS